jgi:tetratricopeptide (TPR) repeat protein
MPPEQAKGELDKVDERSDVFSLGGILYKILTHEAPHSGDTVHDVLRNAEKGRVTPPRKRTRWNVIPAELESICLKAMAPARSSRYGSVEAMIEDVQAFLDRRLIAAHRYSAFARFLRFVQRHPAGSLATGVAMVLIALGSAAMGILAAKAEATAALAKEEKARAEMETLRAERAEESMKVAKRRALDAESALEKSRAVTAVLRAAHMELGEVHRALKISFYSKRNVTAKRADTAKHWPRVEAHEASVPHDSASQAAWLAAKGWLRRLAGHEKEAFALFEKARRVDPDVAYGWLFESMVWLARYLHRLPFPTYHLDGQEIVFVEIYGETQTGKAHRERFLASLAEVKKAPVWGESASGEFGAVVEGLISLEEGDLSEAERDLTTALALPETVWMRGELLFARAWVRYLKRDLERAFEDAETARREQPNNLYGYRLLCSICNARGLLTLSRRGDPRGYLGKAIEISQRYIELSPSGPHGWYAKGVANQLLGNYEDKKDRDAREFYRKSIDDFLRAMEREKFVGETVAQRDRAESWWKLGIQLSKHGLDPSETYERSVADISEFLERNPSCSWSFCVRAVARHLAGLHLEEKKKDPVPAYEKAIADIDRSLALVPDSICYLLHRAALHYCRGHHEFFDLKRDPSSFLDKVITDCDHILRIDPENAKAYCRRGEALRSRGIFEGAIGQNPMAFYEKALADYEIDEAWRGKDPRASFEKALAAYEEALKRFPSAWEVLTVKGLMLERLGRFDEAVAALEKAMKLGGSKQPPIAHRWLARAREKAGKKK